MKIPASVSRDIEGMFGIGFVLGWGPELPAVATRVPRPSVAITIVGIAQSKAFVLHLTAPAPVNGHESGIATDPLVATRRLH